MSVRRGGPIIPELLEDLLRRGRKYVSSLGRLRWNQIVLPKNSDGLVFGDVVYRDPFLVPVGASPGIGQTAAVPRRLPWIQAGLAHHPVPVQSIGIGRS